MNVFIPISAEYDTVAPQRTSGIPTPPNILYDPGPEMHPDWLVELRMQIDLIFNSIRTKIFDNIGKHTGKLTISGLWLPQSTPIHTQNLVRGAVRNGVDTVNNLAKSRIFDPAMQFVSILSAERERLDNYHDVPPELLLIKERALEQIAQIFTDFHGLCLPAETFQDKSVAA